MESVDDVLLLARELGFLGPGPAEEHRVHADAFLAVVEGWGIRRDVVVDLGTGGGVPGLVAAARWPESRFIFVEANSRRATFLRRAVRQLMPGRVVVREDRAERVGRDPELRGQVGLVMARSFAAPAVTAECAAPLLTDGGSLVVSEPPREDASRWPADALRPLGLMPGRTESNAVVAVQELRLVGECSDQFPRGDGVPGRKPLF